MHWRKLKYPSWYCSGLKEIQSRSNWLITYIARMLGEKGFQHLQLKKLQFNNFLGKKKRKKSRNFLAFLHFLLFSFLFPNAESLHKTHRVKDPLQCAQEHWMVSTQIQEILTSHITSHHVVRRPYLVYFAQWLASLANFYHETSQWRQSLSLPTLKNWAVFLFHSKLPPESLF